MNIYAIRVIYKYEMLRAFETIAQSFASPVISTALYFVVFGSAIGSRIESVEGISYGAFIVPGLMMLALFNAGSLIKRRLPMRVVGSRWRMPRAHSR